MRKVTDFKPIKTLVIILSTFLVSASLISPASAGNKPDIVPGNSDNPKCLTSSNASSVAKSAVTKSSQKVCQSGDGLSQATAGTSAWQIKNAGKKLAMYHDKAVTQQESPVDLRTA